MKACVFFLLAVSAIAQPLRFDVASVRPSEPLVNSVSVGFQMDRQQLRITQLPLGYYIQIAYEVKGSQVVSSGSLLQDRFDVTATLPTGASQDKLAEMMRGLLEERFQLKTHREQREMQVYAITLGKGPLKILEVADTPADPNEVVTAGGSGGAQGISLSLGNGSSLTFANNKLEAKKLTLDEVASQLEQFVDRPVVDQTGLKGRYDLALDLATEDFQMMRARSAVNAGFPLPPQILQRMESAQLATVFEAFEKLGLKLETKKLPVPVVVVDRVLKMPTEN